MVSNQSFDHGPDALMLGRAKGRATISFLQSLLGRDTVQSIEAGISVAAVESTKIASKRARQQL